MPIQSLLEGLWKFEQETLSLLSSGIASAAVPMSHRACTASLRKHLVSEHRP